MFRMGRVVYSSISLSSLFHRLLPPFLISSTSVDEVGIDGGGVLELVWLVDRAM